jgi:hypothetical protein
MQMKKLFFVGFIFMILSCKVHKNTESAATVKSMQNADTSSAPKKGTPLHLAQFGGNRLAYLQAIVANKQEYVDKELSVLLNDLELPITRYSTFGSTPPKNSSISRYVILFDSVIIYWKTPLSREDVWKLGDTNKYKWTKEVQAFYGKQVIGDISM